MRGLFILFFVASLATISRADPYRHKRSFRLPSLGYAFGLRKEYTARDTTPVDPEQVYPRPCGIVPAVPKSKDCGDAVYGENPWQVAILEFSRYKRNFLCSGALLNRDYVVTAANCVYEFQPNLEWLRVRLGDWDLLQENCKECYLDLETGVEEILIHDNFNPHTKSYDVALLKLDKRVDLSLYPQILPICLPDYRVLHDASCYVVGWSKAEEKPVGCPDDSYGSVGRVPLKAPVVLKDLLWCRQHIGHGFTLGEDRYCLIGEHGCDVCKADIGSPIICKVGRSVCTTHEAPYSAEAVESRHQSSTECIKEKAYIFGVISWSFQCPHRTEHASQTSYGQPITQKPAVFTRLSKVLDFLKKHLDH